MLSCGATTVVVAGMMLEGVELPVAAKVGRGRCHPTGEGRCRRPMAFAKVQAVFLLQPVVDTILMTLLQGERNIITHVSFDESAQKGPMSLLISITFLVRPGQAQDLLGEPVNLHFLQDYLCA